MNITELVGALVPVFFCLLLGFLAGKAHSFDPAQALGLSKLALGFALPASLFAGMAELPRALLAAQLKLAFCLIIVHLGLLLAAVFVMRRTFQVTSTRSIVLATMLATSATPVFGLAVLSPLLGPTTIAAVGLVALAINLALPAAVILFEVDAATDTLQSTPATERSLQQHKPKSPVLDGLKAGLRSPLLWAPL